MKLYKFSWESNYALISGLFLATEEEIKELIGKELILGEIEGKHSDVYGTFEESDIEEIPVSEDYIKETEKVFGRTILGYNPLHYTSDVFE